MSLTNKNIKFINSLVSGKSKTQAYIDAYDTKNMTRKSIHEEASRTSRKPQVQHAITEALDSQQLTPEYAVNQLKKIAEQDENYGAKRLASIDILKLWGWSPPKRSRFL